MTNKVSKLRKAWNIIRGRHPQENADGTITTKYGHRLKQYRVRISKRGGVHTNAGEFFFQPRGRELEKMMDPLRNSVANDRIIIDRDKGEFFLKSDLDKNGRDRVTVLGQFDPDSEEDDALVTFVWQRATIAKMFHDSPTHTLVYDNDGKLRPQQLSDLEENRRQKGNRSGRRPKPE